ncbi:acyltransferase family protein [Rhodococcus gannanensis]|uniref:Acyltransferase family protein n=1 Tax=Rhodococcus gannanensis TaxID=1960308 RepID=A0ABW4NYM8_9NOCA
MTTAATVATEVQAAPRRFRNDIQGLRAVAVGAVVLYHAGMPWLTGGYVGVDIFFVVSGFLIGGHLLGELGRTGSISVWDFYGRRIRRLMPASILVVLATLLLTRLFVPPLGFVDVAKDGAASALAVANMWFAVTGTDYLANEAPSVFQHYWSLGVEEQFYVVFPLFLLLVCRVLRGGRKVLVAAVWSATVASFVLCVALTESDQPLAFFSLPTRAWELGAGVCLAMFVPQLTTLGPRVAAMLQWAGLAVLMGTIVTFDHATTFPGFLAAVPALGTLLYIAGGCSQPEGRPRAFMENRAMLFIGTISYSLYLWHWPLLIIPVMYSTRHLGPGEAVGLVILAVVAATLTERYVERPFRESSWLASSRRRTFGFGATIAALAALACLATSVLPRLSTDTVGSEWVAGELPADVVDTGTVPANLTPALGVSADSVPAIYADGCHGDFSDTAPDARCVYGDVSSRRAIVLLGDSHAAQWFPALEKISAELGYRLVTMTKSSCPASEVPVWSSSLNRVYTECAQWRDNALVAIDALDPDFVVLSNFQGQKPYRTGSLDPDEVFATGVADLVSALPARTVPVLIGDTPMHDVSPPICLSGNLHSASSCASDADLAVSAAWATEIRERAIGAGATYVDPVPWLCPRGWCPAIVGNVLVYRDRHHLTTEAATMLASPMEESLASAGLGPVAHD